MKEADSLPLWVGSERNRAIAWRHGRAVLLDEFAAHVDALGARLAHEGAMINLCEDRYSFLVAYAAAQSRKHTVLLPASRAEQVVAEVANANPGSYRCEDSVLERIFSDAPERPVGNAQPRGSSVRPSPAVPPDHVCMIGFTSGSTGQPKTYPKLWRSVNGSNARNAGAIRDALQVDALTQLYVVATVPPQHMYGMELTVLLPLIGGLAVHSGRPLFPADIARALAEVPEPRVLVTTPVHLRAIVESNVEFPRTALTISATAPLDAALAQAAERKLRGALLEMFGSTETCVFARRRTAAKTQWQAYAGVQLQPRQDSTVVDAPWFVAPMVLQDVLEVSGDNEFIVRGRNTDLIEVAGKRASLADLTRRVLAVEGVQDAVVFQPDMEAVATIRRVAALVVAPGQSAKAILDKLAVSVDPAFLPRPLLLVDALPRNELGKLPREALLRTLRGA